MIGFEVNTAAFDNWVKQVQTNVRTMTATLLEAGQIVDKNTEPHVPLDWGYLIRSYEANIFDAYPKMEVEISYSGTSSPRYKGYDYAWIQHENFAYKHTHGSAQYLQIGVYKSRDDLFKLFEKDYLSCFGIRL